MGKLNGATKHVWVCTLVASILVLAPIGVLEAQQQAATINGTATDPSGGALAGAKIEATNTGTGISQSTTTDAQGRYTIAELPVGVYGVAASLSGFQTVIHTGLTLTVGATLVVDFSLPVGQINQTVNVEGQVPTVETENSQISTLISPEQMRNLPLNGRNFEQLITLAPGVSTIAPAFNAVTGRLYGMQNNYSIAGSRPTGQMFLLDGTDIRNFWEHGTGSGYGGTSLGVEAIGEFQVITNTYTAQFAGNGAVNATSRSGTNDLHGGAYEFFRNSVLDAMDLPDKNAHLTSPPPFKRNQFGGAIGGPIKKDKLFFFANYEGLRQGLEQTSPIFVPEPYIVQGMLPCYDPTLGTSINSSAACPAPPPLNCATSSSCPPVGTPANPIESVPGQTAATSQREQIAALYGLCNGCRKVGTGTDLGGYVAAATTPNLIVNEDYVLGRVDYTLGPNDSVFARYVIDDARVGDNPRDPLGIFPEKDFTRNQFLTIAERHVASATLVNSIRFGYVRNNENSRVPAHLTAAQISKASAFSTALGGPAITNDPLFFTSSFVDAATREDGQQGLFGPIATVGPDQNRPDTLVQSKFSGGDDVVWTHGAHSLKIGGVVTRVQTNNVQTAYANGALFFAPATFQSYIQGGTGLTFAVPDGANNSTRYFREILVSPYIQDDWKVNSRLTLNIGIRYDYDTNPIGWAAPNLPGGKPQSLTTLVGSYLPPTGPVTPANGLPAFTPVDHVFANNPNAQNWGPRFGFAYDPFRDHKTSIRGGFGVYYDPTSARLYESGFIATPPAGFSLLIGPSWPNPCAAGACGTGTPGSEFAGVDYQVPRGSPYQEQFNLNVQRELWHGTVLTVGYIGSRSRHLWTQMDINIPKCETYPDCTELPQVPKSYPSASNSVFTVNTQTPPPNGAPFNPNGCVITTQTSCYGSGARLPYIVLDLPTGPLQLQGTRINPAFGEMVQAHNTGSAAYDSLQISLNRQFARNLAGQVNYTYSHCIDNGSFASSLEEWGQLVTQTYNQRYDYGNCNFDIRHNFSANGLWALPFKGNRFVEGWQFSTILGIHTGEPLNVYNGSTIDPADLGSEWASRANYSFASGCTPNHIVDKYTIDQSGNRGVQWFDPSCYEAQAPGFFGNIKRNSVPGPGTVSVDISLLKNTKITEKLNMQFRAEAFNFINHFNPGAASPTSPDVLGAINQPGGDNGITLFSQSPVVTPRQIQFALKFDF